MVKQMKISQNLEEKKVKITCTDGEVFTGIVSDYIFPEDNEPEGVAAIDIEDCPQRDGTGVTLYDYEIDSVEIIE